MLFRNTTMSSSDYRLSVRDNAMNPRQKPSRSFGITKDYFAVCQTLILRNPPIGSPSVGPDCLQHLPSFRCSWPTAEPFQKTLNGCSRRIFHHPHMGKPWPLPALLIPIKRNGTQKTVIYLSLPRPLFCPGGPKNDSSISTKPASWYRASLSVIAFRILWAINQAVL